jgi:hypothetical protein
LTILGITSRAYTMLKAENKQYIYEIEAVSLWRTAKANDKP